MRQLTRPAAALVIALSLGLAVAAPASAKASPKKQIKSLAKQAKKGAGAKFKAVYSIVEPGNTQTLTIEQAPPKSLVSAGAGSVIDNGKTTLFCSTHGTCVSLASGATNPFAAIEQIFSPQTIATDLATLQVQVAARHSGYSLHFSSGKYAGQSSKCVTGSGHGHSGTYCVTKGGVLDYLSSSGVSVTMTNYSTSVSDADFSPPAGSTVVTVPTGVSIP